MDWQTGELAPGGMRLGTGDICSSALTGYEQIIITILTLSISRVACVYKHFNDGR